MFQETPPYTVNSPSAASNQQNDQKFIEELEKDNTEDENLNGGEDVESPAKDLNKQFVMVQFVIVQDGVQVERSLAIVTEP